MADLRSTQAGLDGQAPSPADVSRRLLAPKGSCWYCEKPVGEIRRFCGKACAEAYEEEKEFALPPIGITLPYQAPI